MITKEFVIRSAIQDQAVLELEINGTEMLVIPESLVEKQGSKLLNAKQISDDLIIPRTINLSDINYLWPLPPCDLHANVA